MVTVFHINDSRALFSVTIVARDNGVETMSKWSLINNAIYSARHEGDAANAHLQFVTMFAVAGMDHLADNRRAEYQAASQRSSVWYQIANDLMESHA